MANDLKQSTVKLVRQLHENPDVAGNDKMIANHKFALLETIDNLINEQRSDLKFESFEKKIREDLLNQSKFKELKDKEREQNNTLKTLTEKLKKACDEFAVESNVLEGDIAEARKKLNETEIEAQLHIQYKERKNKGDQDCESRKYSQIEREMEEKIAQLKRELETEKRVNEAITTHLKARSNAFKEAKRDLDDKSGAQKKEDLEA